MASKGTALPIVSKTAVSSQTPAPKAATKNENKSAPDKSKVSANAPSTNSNSKNSVSVPAITSNISNYF